MDLKNIDNTVSKILNEITNYNKKKSSVSLLFSINTTDWTTQISPPIILDNKDNYEIGLVDLET